jgi:large subunit ribosomal protein L25
MQVTVECQKRPEGSKPKALRREGSIPAALYGHNGTESISLIINEKDASTLLRKASINNTLIDLKVSDVPWNGKVLIREVQAHPWRKTLYHLSFFSVASHDRIEVSVPLTLVGNAAGVKQGGLIEQMKTELSVQCSPDRIPESIEINVADMEIGATLLVKDLALPSGVVALDEPDSSILAILAPTKIEEEPEAEAQE